MRRRIDSKIDLYIITNHR